MAPKELKLLKGSHMIGQKETKRQQLGRELRTKRAGLELSDNSLLFRSRKRRAEAALARAEGGDSDDGATMASSNAFASAVAAQTRTQRLMVATDTFAAA